jgi:predicted dienelactone hydrolase
LDFRWPARLGLVLAMLLMAVAPSAVAGVLQKQIAGLDVAVWLPDPASAGPWPVIVFSHGFHGCNTQSTFLTAALAQAGYAVFAPNHHDAACHDLRAWAERPDVSFGDPERWTEDTYADRGRDIRHLLDALQQDPAYRDGRLDFQHIGLVGHSLGGYTALGLAGAWPGWKDPRVKCVVALSPYATPYGARSSLGGIAGIPVMFQGGTRDVAITPFVARAGGIYDQSPAPKFFVEFTGAGHFAWTDLNPTFQPSIIAYTSAFLDQSLKGTAFPPALKKRHGDVSDVRSTP